MEHPPGNNPSLRQGLAVGVLWALTCIVFTLALPPSLHAKNIYKYQDENGIWHFTDRAPDDDTEFETVYMEREPEPRVRLRKEGTDASPVYVLFNDYWGPVEVELRLQDAINVLSEPPLPARFVVPGQKEQTLVGLGAVNPRQGFQYRLQMSTVPGPPLPEPVGNLLIPPPFGSGEVYPISQGFEGTRTHNSEDSRFAVDIVMPIGTEILSVRDGVVMDVEEDFNRGGTDVDKFGDKANHVRILHEDGTMSLFAHLDLASVIVRSGARVRAGQVIARSGNTGYSTGPHLHFAIQQNLGLRVVSLPFRFEQPGGGSVLPADNMPLAGTLAR